jgi:hypothetical protein
MANQTLSDLEKQTVIDSLSMEIENAFDRLLNQFSKPDQAKYAQFAWELETYTKRILRAYQTN